MTLTIPTLKVKGGGKIGVVRLPGATGDLDGDLAVLLDWPADAVVSMTETAEMAALGSDALGSLLRQNGIAWFHFPIRDFSIPDTEATGQWPDLARQLHKVLDRGGSLLLHCRGGRGRSGMIALRLMIERGTEPQTALEDLRAIVPGAVETEAQFAWASDT